MADPQALLVCMAAQRGEVSTPMGVILKPLTKENYEQCLQLQVREDQQDLVASNLQSIADSKVYPELIPLTIYHKDEMVGFLMYSSIAEDGVYWILRLMIDQHYQGKGYARDAMIQLLTLLKEFPDCVAIKISYEPSNSVAEKLYESLGFQKTGKMVEEEVVARLPVRDIS